MLLDGIGGKGQRALAESVALIAGVGALGSAAADGLARAGVGTLILVDRDVVELSNLQRQVLFDEEDVAARRPKAEAARRKIKAINGDVNVVPMVDDLNYRTIDGIVGPEGRPDVIIDGLDNFETRFLLNDYAVKNNVPYVYGGAVGTRGMVYTVLPDRGPKHDPRGATPCLRCLFGGPPAPGSTPTCETAGVLGPAVTVTAGLEVAAALKVLTGQWGLIRTEVVHFDLWINSWRAIRVCAEDRWDQCPCCFGARFEFLDGSSGGRAITLCGQSAVQLSRRDNTECSPLDLVDLGRKLETHGRVHVNAFLLRLDLQDEGKWYELTVFRDGRAIVKGTEDTAIARGIFSRYVGG